MKKYLPLSVFTIPLSLLIISLLFKDNILIKNTIAVASFVLLLFLIISFISNKDSLIKNVNYSPQNWYLFSIPTYFIVLSSIIKELKLLSLAVALILFILILLYIGKLLLKNKTLDDLYPSWSILIITLLSLYLVNFKSFNLTNYPILFYFLLVLGFFVFDSAIYKLKFLNTFEEENYLSLINLVSLSSFALYIYKFKLLQSNLFITILLVLSIITSIIFSIYALQKTTSTTRFTHLPSVALSLSSLFLLINNFFSSSHTINLIFTLILLTIILIIIIRLVKSKIEPNNERIYYKNLKKKEDKKNIESFTQDFNIKNNPLIKNASKKSKKKLNIKDK